MRPRTLLVVAGTAAGILACIPDPDGDFKDYEERANAFATPTDGGGNFDAAGGAPREPIEGVYYGACLSQLAFGQPSKVFNFYTGVNYTPEPAGGGKLSLTLQALKLSPAQGPPANVSAAGVSGEKRDAPATVPNVEQAGGRYRIELGRMTVPGDANPITGRDVIIEATALTGFFASKDRFCARLNGNVTQPLELTLDPPKNICQFVPVKDGDPTPTFTQEDFAAGACPY